jgi:hypothetical protein
MPKSRGENDPTYEGRVSIAIDALNNKKIAHVRRAARLFNVSEATLWNRLKGMITQKEVGVDRCKLMSTEEASLWSWIFLLERCGLPPRHLMLQKMADLLLAERDKTKTPKKKLCQLDVIIFKPTTRS